MLDEEIFVVDLNLIMINFYYPKTSKNAVDEKTFLIVNKNSDFTDNATR